jgi:hypothetical protein
LRSDARDLSVHDLNAAAGQNALKLIDGGTDRAGVGEEPVKRDQRGDAGEDRENRIKGDAARERENVMLPDIVVDTDENVFPSKRWNLRFGGAAALVVAQSSVLCVGSAHRAPSGLRPSCKRVVRAAFFRDVPPLAWCEDWTIRSLLGSTYGRAPSSRTASRSPKE